MIKLYLKIIFAVLIGLCVVKFAQTGQKTDDGTMMKNYIDESVGVIKNNNPNIKRKPYIIGTGGPIPIPDRWEGDYYRKPYNPDESSNNVK